MAEKKIYLKNADLLAETIKSREQGHMTPRLAEMLMLLVSRYARKGNFSGYSYRDDMESHALLSLCKSWASFDPSKSSNAFAYYTTSVKRSFIQVLNAEKKHRDIRDSLLVENGLDPSFSYQDRHSSHVEHAEEV